MGRVLALLKYHLAQLIQTLLLTMAEAGVVEVAVVAADTHKEDAADVMAAEGGAADVADAVEEAAEAAITSRAHKRRIKVSCLI